MATLKTIGERLGLSVTTVSRALNGFPEVGEETRSRVVAMARSLNYRPNQLARKLVSGRSGMVGLLLHTPQQLEFYGHFFEIVSNLSASLFTRDVDLVLNVCPDGDVMGLYHRMIDRGAMDGFIITGPEADDPRIDLLLERDLPFVVHGTNERSSDYAFFDIDNHGVGYRSAAVLAGFKHRRIAIINGPENLSFSRQRLQGFVQALAERDIALPLAYVQHGDASEGFGAAAMAELLATDGLGPTAVVCTNTLVASGALTTLGDLGLSVPGDVSVIAHDDALPQLSSARFRPALTVTRAPLREASETLAEFLVRRIAGEPAGALQVTRPVDLVLRESVTTPPDA